MLAVRILGDEKTQNERVRIVGVSCKRAAELANDNARSWPK